jgi:hypothetical protein
MRTGRDGSQSDRENTNPTSDKRTHQAGQTVDKPSRAAKSPRILARVKLFSKSARPSTSMASFRRSENESAVAQRAARKPLAQVLSNGVTGKAAVPISSLPTFSVCGQGLLAERGEFELPVPIVNSEITGIKCTYESNKSATNAQTREC